MKIGKFLEHLGKALIILAVLLIVLWWTLNFIAKKAPSPISGFASTTANIASGAAYGY